ncbi:MAG: hypothetical protein K9G70_09080 [Prolixibacteraceae bacterium]|nr:hypothetical protein [Prolixibacteraceae bacterium]
MIIYYLTAEDAENIGAPALTSGYFEHTREEPLDKSYYKDFDYGIGGRLSVIYKINSCMALRFSGGYRHGLINILKPNDGWLEKYTRSFNLTVGFAYAFRHKIWVEKRFQHFKHCAVCAKSKGQ